MKNKVKEILATILELNESDIIDNFSQQSCSNWDSLNHLNLIKKNIFYFINRPH